MNIITINVGQGGCGSAPLLIGYAGEDSVDAVDFDFSAWAQGYGEGTIALELMRASDTAPYPAILTVDDTTARWAVSDVDTAHSGPGVAQLIYKPARGTKKSAIYKFYVGRSLTEPGGADPWQAIIERMEEILAEMQQQSAAADQSAEDASGSARDAEAWAVGERGGEPVPVTDPTHENNAKYYAEQTGETAREFTEETAPAAVRSVNEAGQAQTQAVNAAGAAAVQAVNTEKAGALNAIDTAGQTAVSTVDTAKDNSLAAIGDAQASAVSAVQQEGTTQQAAVEQKGEDALAALQEYADLPGEVDDLKSALENGTYVTDKYVSGARNNSGNISANASRCTTKEVFQLIAGDTISIKNLDAGLRVVIAGVSENSFVYDSGGKTDEFSYTVTNNTQGLYFLNFSKQNNENISPSDIITSQVVVKNYHYLNKIDKISLLENAINDQPSETVLAKTISSGYINYNGTIDTTVGGYRICTLQDAELIESIVVSNLSADYKYYCFYDSSDTPIGGRKSLATDTKITIPDGVSIIRICSATNAINSCIITAGKYTPLHSVFADTEELQNLVNTETYVYPSGITNDAYITPSGGIATGASGYLACDYVKLPFNESQSFQIRGVVYGNASCAIYNANFEALLVITESNLQQYGGLATSGLQTLTIPYIEGMRYARMSARTAGYSELTDLWTKGNTLTGAFKRICNIETELQAIEANVSTVIASSKVLVLGDSISTDAYGSYPKWVTDLINTGFLPADTTNSSQHATGFVARYNNEANDFITRLKAIQNPSQYDFVVVFGGINDYIQNIPMGSESGTDYAVSFKPAVNEFFSYLIQNFTQARLCVLLPLRTYATWTNSAGEYQQAYGDYIKQVAKSYCLPVLNLTEDSGFCPYVQTFRDMWTLIPAGHEGADGVHPNQEYERRFLAPMIKHFLQGLM